MFARVNGENSAELIIKGHGGSKSDRLERRIRTRLILYSIIMVFSLLPSCGVSSQPRAIVLYPLSGKKN